MPFTDLREAPLDLWKALLRLLFSFLLLKYCASVGLREVTLRLSQSNLFALNDRCLCLSHCLTSSCASVSQL